MTDKGPRIVFMGTPAFAAASLHALHAGGYAVTACVTAPDKPSGRGRHISFSPVKKYALEHNIKIFQPERLRDETFIKALRDLKADIFVVVAFRVLPEEVWSIPPMGTFNLHASLLPQYRGAAPINHAIINGETVTGVTTFLIDKEIDTGKILLSREVIILPEDNAGSLHDRLMTIGADLVIETVNGLCTGSLSPVPQKEEEGKVLYKAPKIFPPDTVINWNDPAIKIHNKIRGLSPYPGAVTQIRSGERTIRIKILESRITDENDSPPATLHTDGKSRLVISCGAGALEILSLQPEGRRRMTTPEYLRGFDITGWQIV